MRVLIFIALLFTFSVGFFHDAAHAGAMDQKCVHAHIDQSDNVDKEPCHSEQQQEQCDDCCCVHSHSMTVSSLTVNMPEKVRKKNLIFSVENSYSADLEGLRRPPRL